MSRCTSCLRVCSYILIPLVGVISYLHLQCLREAEEKEQLKNKLAELYRPHETVVRDYPLPFYSQGSLLDASLPFIYFIAQWFPCCLLKLMSPLLGSWPPSKSTSMEEHNVTFHDARKASPGTFAETGFTLIQLEKEADTVDWLTNYLQNATADVTKYHQQMEPHLKSLYPKVKRIKWFNNIARGGNAPGFQPAAVDGPHLDFHQNRTARTEYHKIFQIQELYGLSMNAEAAAMIEKSNGVDELGVMLSVWKPVRPGKPVCDHPLAVMDARTFTQEHDNPMKFSISIPILGLLGYGHYNLHGAISYDAKQRWYYWPFQKTNEVLVFHHYSSGRFWANPHTSFKNPNCPPDTETRISAEMRVALYF